MSLFLIIATDTAFSLKLWDDYILYNTGAQTFSPTPLPMVFAGYGIFAPEYDYNDYHDLEVENRIVVFFSGEPPSEDPAWFEGKKPTIYSDPAMKHRLALARGARGSIMIPLPRERTYLDWAYWRDQFVFEDIRLPYNVSDNLNVLLNYQKARRLFRNTELSLKNLLALDAMETMQSFPLSMQTTFQGRFQERDFVAANVVAISEGSDPLLRDSYLLISAHYDHLGIGTPVQGDSIYNGVVDNAIGTAALLEMARIFAAMPEKPRRAIVFLFTTGEEKGLLGSRYYCDRPVVPLHKTLAAKNQLCGQLATRTNHLCLCGRAGKHFCDTTVEIRIGIHQRAFAIHC